MDHLLCTFFRNTSSFFPSRLKRFKDKDERKKETEKELVYLSYLSLFFIIVQKKKKKFISFDLNSTAQMLFISGIKT